MMGAMQMIKLLLLYSRVKERSFYMYWCVEMITVCVCNRRAKQDLRMKGKNDVES